jgi:hypothetical protein
LTDNAEPPVGSNSSWLDLKTFSMSLRFPFMACSIYKLYIMAVIELSLNYAILNLKSEIFGEKYYHCRW